MKHVIWRGNCAYIQRRIPKALRPAFHRPGAAAPDSLIRYALGVSRTEYRDDRARVEALIAHEYKKHAAWFAAARTGSLVWPPPGPADNFIEITALDAAGRPVGGPQKVRVKVIDLPWSQYQPAAQAQPVNDPPCQAPDAILAERSHGAVLPYPVRLQSDAGKTCSELIEVYVAERGMSAKLAADYRLWVGRFEKVVGRRAPKDVDELDVATAYAQFKKIVSHHARRGPIDFDTLARGMKEIRMFFKWAKNTRRCLHNPFANFEMTRPDDAAANDGEPYTIAELNKVFAHPVFSQTWDSRQWVGLIGLFSGMRLAEITQLEFDDIIDLHGRKHFAVNAVSHHGHVKSLKTQQRRNNSSARVVPVHPALIERGLLDWIGERKRASRDGRILDANQRYSAWWRKITQEAGVWVFGRKTFKSMRHNFEDALRNATEDHETRERYVGHYVLGASAHYGQKRVGDVTYPEGVLQAAQSTVIDRIRYDGFVLPPRA